MPLRNDARILQLFQKRSNSVWGTVRRRGAVDLDLQGFRAFVSDAIGSPCPYCGTKLQVSNFTADHKVSVAAGGCSSRANLVVCCKRCNKAKSDIPFEKFLALCKFMQETMPENLSRTLSRMSIGSSFTFGAERRRDLAKESVKVPSQIAVAQ